MDFLAFNITLLILIPKNKWNGNMKVELHFGGEIGVKQLKIILK